MGPKNKGIRYKRHARLNTILGCIISRKFPATYIKQVKRKWLTSHGIAETEIYPVEYMGFSHYSVIIVKFKVVTFLGYLIKETFVNACFQSPPRTSLLSFMGNENKFLLPFAVFSESADCRWILSATRHLAIGCFDRGQSAEYQTF